MKYNTFFKKTIYLLLSSILFTLITSLNNAGTPAIADASTTTGTTSMEMPVQHFASDSSMISSNSSSDKKDASDKYNITVSEKNNTYSVKKDTSSEKKNLSSKKKNAKKKNVTSVKKKALAAYDNFLAGKINAQDLKHEISDGVVTIKDISLEPDYKTYYTLFDMNGDGIPELHLRPIVGGSYVIFTYRNGKVVLWHNGPDYEAPLNNGAILYERNGAAPTHTNYYYLVLDSNGKEVSKVSFSKYHSVDESTLTESTKYDVFMLEDKEVSEKKWNSKTKEYLSKPSDLIVWNEL